MVSLSTGIIISDECISEFTALRMKRAHRYIILKVSEDKVADRATLDVVSRKSQDFGVKVMQISAKIEAELSALPSEERDAFLKDLHIETSALNQLSRMCFEALGLISFFTVGKDEVRQWTTKRNATAPQAAGSIHSDLERGFIRAEIMKYAELIASGDENKLKEAGKIYLKGKDYIVEEGDIVHVRFSV